jgi:hypothetical protein
MKFELLAAFDNYVEAHIVQSRLEDQGIRCWLKDEHTMTITPMLDFALGGIKLMVAEPQLERAKEVLSQPLSDPDQGVP